MSADSPADTLKSLTRSKTRKNVLRMHARAAGVDIEPTPPGTARPGLGAPGFSRNQSRPKLLANVSKHRFRTEAAAALAISAMMPSAKKPRGNLNQTRGSQNLTKEESLGGQQSSSSNPLTQSGAISLGQSGSIPLTQSGPIALKAPPTPEEANEHLLASTSPGEAKERKSRAVVERYLQRVTSSDVPRGAREQHPSYKRRQSLESLHDFHMGDEHHLPIDMTKMTFRDVSNIWRNEDPTVVRNALHGFFDYGNMPMTLDTRMTRAGLLSAFEMGLINKVTYEISISCRSLHRHQANVLLEVDPQCLLLRQREVGYDEWTEVLKTERLMNTTAPKFHKTIKFESTDAELEQTLKFIIYDDQCPFGRQHRVGRNNTLGVMECKLWEVVEACRSDGYFMRGLKRHEDGIATSGYGDVLAHGVMILSVEERGKDREGKSLQLLRSETKKKLDGAGSAHTEGGPAEEDGAAGVVEGVGSGAPARGSSGQQEGHGSLGLSLSHGHSSVLGEALQASRQALGLSVRSGHSVKGSGHDWGEGALTEGGFEVVDYRPRVERWMQHLQVQGTKLFDKFRDLAGHSVLAGVEGRKNARHRALDLIEFLNLLAAVGIVQLAQSKITAASKPSPLGELTKTEASEFFKLEASKGGHEIDFEGFKRCMDKIIMVMAQRVRKKYDTRPDSPPFPPPGGEEHSGEEGGAGGELEGSASGSDSEAEEEDEAEAWWTRLGRGHMAKHARNHAVHEACHTLLDMAASSRFAEIKKTAAPGIAALALTDQDVVKKYEGISVMLELSQRAGNARVKADCLDAVQQLVKAGGDKQQLVALGGLGWILQCRLSSSVDVRRKGLEVLAAVLVQGGKEVGDRWSDEVLKGLCLYAKNKDQRVAETAARLLLKLTRMAVRHGELWEVMRAKAGPLAVDHVEEGKDEDGKDDEDDKESDAADTADDFGEADWTVNTTGVGEEAERGGDTEREEERMSGLEMLLHLLGSSDIGLGGPQLQEEEDLATIVKRQRGVKVGGEFGERGWVNVGSLLLGCVWSILEQRDSYLLEVGSEALIRKGLGAVLASQMKRRSRSPVGEADMLALRCVARLATLIIGNALDVMPEEVVKQVVGMLMIKRERPFLWMTADELKLLTERCKYEKYPKGTVLISQGEHRRVLFLLMEGEVEIRVRLGGQGRAVEVSKLAAGDSFGCKSMIIGEGSTATLETLDDCVLVEMTFQVLNSVLVTRPALLSAAREYRLHLIEHDRIKYRARWAQGIPAHVLAGASSHLEDNAHHAPKTAPTKEALRVASRTAIHNVVTALPHLQRFLEPTQGHLKAPALSHAAQVESHQLVLGIVLDCLRIQQAEAVFDAGLLPPLLRLLSSSAPSVQRLAARALVQLAHSESFNQKLARTVPPRPPARDHGMRRRGGMPSPRSDSMLSMGSNASRAGFSRTASSGWGRTGSSSSMASERSVATARLFRSGMDGAAALGPFVFSEARPLALQMVQALLVEFVNEHRVLQGSIVEGFQKMSKEPPLLELLLRCQAVDAVKRRLRKPPVPAVMVLRAIKLGQELNRTQHGRAVLAGVGDGGDGVAFLDCLEDAVEAVGLTGTEDKGEGVGARVLAAFEEFLAGLGESLGGGEGALGSVGSEFGGAVRWGGEGAGARDGAEGEGGKAGSEGEAERKETFLRRAELMDDDDDDDDDDGVGGDGDGNGNGGGDGTRASGPGEGGEGLLYSRTAGAEGNSGGGGDLGGGGTGWERQHESVTLGQIQRSVSDPRLAAPGRERRGSLEVRPAPVPEEEVVDHANGPAQPLGSPNRRIRSLARAVGYTAMRLLHGSQPRVIPEQVEASEQEGRDLLRNATRHKRAVISKFLANAHAQAEEDWEANIEWLHGRKTNRTVDDLKRWQVHCDIAARKSFKAQLGAVYEDLHKADTDVPYMSSFQAYGVATGEWAAQLPPPDDDVDVFSRASSAFSAATGSPPPADAPHHDAAAAGSEAASPRDTQGAPPRPAEVPHLQLPVPDSRGIRPASAGVAASAAREPRGVELPRATSAESRAKTSEEAQEERAGGQARRATRPASARPASGSREGGGTTRRRPATARAPLTRRMWTAAKGGRAGGKTAADERVEGEQKAVVEAWLGPRPGGRVGVGTHSTRLHVRQWICEEAKVLAGPESHRGLLHLGEFKL